jgi:tellurite resistance protein TehA-like permease
MSHPKQKKPLNIKKYWPVFSIFLLLAIIVTSLLWPQAARPLAWTALCLGLGLAIFATVWRDYQPYKQGLIPRRTFVRALVINLVGLLLSTLAAISAASWAGSAAARAVWEAAGLLWIALLVSLTAGLAAGLGAGRLVRFLWGWLFRPKRVPGMVAWQDISVH